MSNCACNAEKVKARCTDVRVAVILVADENGNVITDSAFTAIMIGTTRTGATQEFEFNRQLPPETP